MKFLRFAVAVAIPLAALAGCAEQEKTCGTLDVPPIAADAPRCESGETGFTWYTAAAHDVSEPSERPVTGQPLDGDWWDPNDKYEVAKVPTATPKATPAPTSAAKPSTAKPTPTRAK